MSSGAKRITLVLREGIPAHDAVREWISQNAEEDGRGLRAQALLVAALKHFADAGLSPYEAEIRRIGDGGVGREPAKGTETKAKKPNDVAAKGRTRAESLARQLDDQDDD